MLVLAVNCGEESAEAAGVSSLQPLGNHNYLQKFLLFSFFSFGNFSNWSRVNTAGPGRLWILQTELLRSGVGAGCPSVLAAPAPGTPGLSAPLCLARDGRTAGVASRSGADVPHAPGAVAGPPPSCLRLVTGRACISGAWAEHWAQTRGNRHSAVSPKSTQNAGTGRVLGYGRQVFRVLGCGVPCVAG